MAAVTKLISGALMSAGFLAATPAFSNCSKLSPFVTQPIVESFVRNPEFLIITQRDMEKLAASISDVVSYDDRHVLPLVVKLARSASDDQKMAIGAGLGGAAVQCDLVQPETARDIRENVMMLHDPIVAKAFDDAYGTFSAPASDMLGSGMSTMGTDPVSAATAPMVSGGTLTTPGKSDEPLGDSKLRLNLNSRVLSDPFAPVPLPDPMRKLEYRHIMPGT